MKKILIILFLLFVNNSFGQITSGTEASETLIWLIENPQIESDSIFVEKAANIFKWQALNHPNSEMRVKGLSDFMIFGGNYIFFEEIVMIYMLSEFDVQINKNLKKNESAYFAMLNVLVYYNKLIELDPDYNNSILDKYSSLSEKELRRKIRRL